ncbi:hypothetical protein AHiyo1_43240 [Arthrobacter sp. Hiyo1]|nr:hypothetical protein AHiyo1_43240 [Arthrobacter sp. Hiyo1]
MGRTLPRSVWIGTPRWYHPGLPLLRLRHGNRALPPEHLRPLRSPERTSRRCCASTSPRVRSPRQRNCSQRSAEPSAPKASIPSSANPAYASCSNDSPQETSPSVTERYIKNPTATRGSTAQSAYPSQATPWADHYLALFERWLPSKLDDIDDPDVRHTLSSPSPAGTTCDVSGASPQTGNPPATPYTARSKKSPKPSNSSPGSDSPTDGPRLLRSGGRRRIAGRHPHHQALHEDPSSSGRSRTGAAQHHLGFRQARRCHAHRGVQRHPMLKACLTDNVDSLSYRVAGCRPEGSTLTRRRPREGSPTPGSRACL